MKNVEPDRKCPECGRGDLVDILFTEGSTLAETEEIQEADTQQVEIYSCGHEVRGPSLGESATASNDMEVERRQTDETTEPI